MKPQEFTEIIGLKKFVEDCNSALIYELMAMYGKSQVNLCNLQRISGNRELVCAKGFNIRRYWCLNCEFEKECEFNDY